MACHRRTTFSWRDKVALAFNYTPSRREIINWLRDGRDELSSRWEMRERFAPFYIQLDSWLHDLSVPKTRHCIDTHITFIKRIIFKKKKKSPKHPCDCGAARLYECEWRDLWASRGACVISFGHGESNEITPRRLYNSGRIIKKKRWRTFSVPTNYRVTFLLDLYSSQAVCKTGWVVWYSKTTTDLLIVLGIMHGINFRNC